MARTAQIYELVLAANATETLLVEGGFYKLLAASGDVKIAREGGSAIGPMLPGQGERIDFRRLTITNLTASPNTVDVLVADDSFVDTRVYGAVNVIDGGRLLTMTDAAYVGTATVVAAAGLYSCAQLWNPPGNTKWASIARVICVSTASSAHQLRPANVALATAGNIPQPKKILTGTSNSTMQVRTDQNVGTPGGSVIGFVWQTGNVPFVFDFKEPIILKPGQGLNVIQANVNTSEAANFDFIEFTP